MPEMVKKRCAVYCRKSTDENLSSDFNSLDAQREAAENYIASQKANGWVCLPEHYDDGGYSGGNTNRPALQKLLNDCEAGLVDIIVVYKIDRLSRSICDFADLSKKFDDWGVQFVSVTQEINTATSAGRMMLNILITFAQYEREVIAERIKDKMAASRRKGKWVGGNVPFGYVVENKRLVVCADEAKIVRCIFQRFIEIQAPKLIAGELNAAGYRTRQGKPWRRDHVYRVLNNHTYIGEVKYKDAVCKGEQEAIVTREVWDRTQEIQKSNRKEKDPRDRQGIIAPLKGILRCGHCGCAMMPTYSNKGVKRYYYYQCYRDSKHSTAECPVHQIPSGDVEMLIRLQLRKILAEPGMVAQFAEQTGFNPSEIMEFFKEDFWNELTPGEYNRMVQLLVEKAVVWEDRLEIELKTAGIKSLMEVIENE
ncbi:MAG: recombinase family protein [Lentisphaeria bacterium]|nr:recombinase family protein [Lentisphaeria bacterium]